MEERGARESEAQAVGPAALDLDGTKAAVRSPDVSLGGAGPVGKGTVSGCADGAAVSVALPSGGRMRGIRR